MILVVPSDKQALPPPGGSGSPVLQVAQVELLPTSRCNQSYARELGDFGAKWPNGITDDTFLCAGTHTGGIDTCQVRGGGRRILKCVDLSRCNYPPYWNRAERHSRTLYQ